MNIPSLSNLRILAALVCAVLAVPAVSGDTVETKNGARLVGKVTKIEGGKVFLSTDYAGDLTVKQADVVTISTEAPVTVRLASGTVMQGRIATAEGGLRISGTDGELSTTVDKVAASWGPGGEDPKIVALQQEIAGKARKWGFEAVADIKGKTGNGDQLGTGASFIALLSSNNDALKLYSAYDRQISDGLKTADQFKAGIDYSNNFEGRYSWYLRDEGGFDRVKDVKLYNVAAAGLGYDLIKEAKHKLTVRGGLSYRYEGYNNPATTDVSSAGLDLGLNHMWEFEKSRLVNSLSFIPSFDDFSNFRATHESYYEVPLINPAWKLRVGVSNDYNSKPGAGVEKMDTGYFTRLVMSWR